MDFEDQQALQPYLLSGENLLWTGRPQTGFVLTKADIFRIPFSLLWGGFAVFWEYLAYTSGAPPFFLLFGAPFVVIGIYIIAGRFFVDLVRRGKTVYGLTEDRVLILSGFATPSLKAFQIRELPEITLSVRPDRRGTITFGPTTIFDGMRFDASWRGGKRVSSPAFELVENAPDVYQTIQGLQRQGDSRGQKSGWN